MSHEIIMWNQALKDKTFCILTSLLPMQEYKLVKTKL